MNAFTPIKTKQQLDNEYEIQLLAIHAMSLKNIPLYPQIKSFLKDSGIETVNQILDFNITELCQNLNIESEVAEYVFNQIDHYIPTDCQFIFPFLPRICFDKPVRLLQLLTELEKEIELLGITNLAQLAALPIDILDNQSFVVQKAFARYIHLFRRTYQHKKESSQKNTLSETAPPKKIKKFTNPLDSTNLDTMLPLPIISQDDIISILYEKNLLPQHPKLKEISFQLLAHSLKKLWNNPLNDFQMFDSQVLKEYSIQTLGELLEAIFKNNLKWLQHNQKQKKQLPPPSLQLTPILIHIRQEHNQKQKKQTTIPNMFLKVSQWYRKTGKNKETSTT